MASSRWDRVLKTLGLRANYERQPVGLKWRSNTIFILAAVGVGLFTDHFLYGLIVPILPFMLEEQVGVPKYEIQRHVDGLLAAYAGASVAISPFAGVLADKMPSRQGPFLAGLSALLGATILLFLGRSVPVLVIARILQGISGAIVWIVGLALCLETVGPGKLGTTIGTIFSCISVGNLSAPTLGGVLYQSFGYVGPFTIALAVIVVDFILRLLVIEKKIAKLYTKDDPEPEEESDAGSPDEAEPDEEAPLLANEDDTAYKLSEKQPWLVRHAPILPCLKNPRLLTAILVALNQAIILGSFDATVPIVARELFGFNALQAGALFLPLALELVLGPLFGYLTDRFGTKPVAVGGFSYLIIPLVLLRLPQTGGMEQIVLYGGLLALCGLGLAAIGAPSFVEAGAVVEKYYKVQPEHFGGQEPYAQLYSLNNLVFSLGLAIGPELAGELKEAIGYGNMNIVIAGLCAVTSLLCFAFMGGTPSMLRRRKQ